MKKIVLFVFFAGLIFISCKNSTQQKAEEIEKQEVNYEKLLKHLDIAPNNFLMIGNSLKSDILPLVNIGAKAAHVPFHTTWQHERVEENDIKDKTYLTLKKINDILSYLN